MLVNCLKPETYLKAHDGETDTIRRLTLRSPIVSLTRHGFVRWLCATASLFSFDQLLRGAPLNLQFMDVAREAGLRTRTIFGDEKRNRYLLETNGCGVAFIDYENDGWLDILFVNGTRFEATYAPGRSAGEPALQEQPGRYIHRRDAQGRPRAHRLGSGRLRGRLRQRRQRGPVRHLLGRLLTVAQQR
jgi:hypothetical protein